MGIQAAVTTHQLFVAFWVGATVYVTVAVLSALRDGEGNTAMVERLSSRFTVLSLVSAAVLFLTGGRLRVRFIPSRDSSRRHAGASFWR